MLKSGWSELYFMLTKIILGSRQHLIIMILIVVCIMLITVAILTDNLMNYLRLKSESALLYAQRSTIKLAHSKLVLLHSQVKNIDLAIDAEIKKSCIQDVPSFTHHVDISAGKYTAKVTGWRTLSVQHYPLYNELLLELSAQGDYAALIMLLKELLRLRQVLSIEDIRIDKTLIGKVLKLHVTLKIYQLLRLDIHKAYEFHDESKLEFLGLLSQGKRVWAMICFPGGRIKHVQVGDFVSDSLGNIISIDTTSLLTAKNQRFILHGAHNSCRMTSIMDSL